LTKIETYGFIKEGQLFLPNRKRFDAEIKICNDADVRLIVKQIGKRSLPSNNYYRGVVCEEIRHELIRRGERFTNDQIHEWAKGEFNPITIELKGSKMSIGDTTTDMNQSEFSEYVDRIIEWAAKNLEIHIPPPNTQTSIF
jgi:hypothetical protein